MATLRALRRRVAELGCEYEDTGTCMMLSVPRGFRLAGAQIHMFDLDYGRGEWLKPDAYDAMLEEMRMGLEPCPDPDCDYCNGR